MVPPCAVTSSRTTANPMPEPATSRWLRPRQRRSKTWGSASSGIPGPLSATCTAASPPVVDTRTVTYDRLLAEGLTGEPAALGVGRTVETTDIADLRAAAEGLTAPDVQRVYQQLLNASQQHLAAFEYRR
jgi:Uncharacterized protein domain (DUF2202)